MANVLWPPWNKNVTKSTAHFKWRASPCHVIISWNKLALFTLGFPHYNDTSDLVNIHIILHCNRFWETIVTHAYSQHHPISLLKMRRICIKCESIHLFRYKWYRWNNWTLELFNKVKNSSNYFPRFQEIDKNANILKSIQFRVYVQRALTRTNASFISKSV